MDAATQRAMAGFGAAAPDGPAGLAVRGYLAEQSRAFLTHSALPVQQAAAVRLRAACRRVGSALAACRDLVDPAWADELGAELEATARVLAAERDADAVRPRLLAPLDRWIAEGRYPDGGAARTRTLLTRMLDRERSAAHGAATAALVGPGFHALADRMATLARDVPLTPAAERACEDVLPEIAGAAYDAWHRLAEHLPEPLTAEDAEGDARWLAAVGAAEAALHTTELCRPAGAVIGGHDPAALITRLTLAAGALSEQRDAVLAADCVHRAADTPRIAATTGYVLGRLHEEQRLAVLRARSSAMLLD
ncbi:CHAD domain-containing protein [Catenulispora subtropica]|uniref:CHAD domain-containing protein n=1 Tax=Catenulispora subtropica TaxID=450798 RepID=A0ABN2T437_9ACTN